jgi:enoyl-CoA hydratase
VAEIVGRLSAEGTDWAAETLAALRTMSPSSVHWSFAAVRAGAGRTLPECLAAELALTRTVTAHPDFAEGVRAMVIDKDRKPRWTPARLEDVDPDAIARMFAG